MLPIHVEQSRWIATDAPAVTFALCSVALALEWATRRGSLVWLLGAGGFAGLAASTKYNLGLVGIVLLVWVLVHRARRPYALLTFFGSMVFAFFAVTPYALLDTPRFAEGVVYELVHYLERGHLEATVRPGREHLSFIVRLLQHQLGAVLSVLCAVGLWRAVRCAPGRLLVALFVLQIGLTSLTTVFFARNLLFAAVVATVLAGWGASWVVVAARARFGHPGGSNPSAAGFLTIALSTTVVMAVGWRLFEQVQVARASLLRPADSRSLATTYLGERLCRSGGSLAIDQTLRLHPVDVARLEGCEVRTVLPDHLYCLPGAEAPPELRLAAGGYQAMLGARETVHAATLTRLADAARAEQEVERWGSRPASTTHYSVDPFVVVLDPSRGSPANSRPCPRWLTTVGSSGGSGRIETVGQWTVLQGMESTLTTSPTAHRGGPFWLSWKDKGNDPTSVLEVIVEALGATGERRSMETATGESTFRVRRHPRVRTLRVAHVPEGLVSVRFRVRGGGPTSQLEIRDLQAYPFEP